MRAIDDSVSSPSCSAEQQRFVNERPKSKALFERAGKVMLGGVPMNWMVNGPRFPAFVREAQGAQLL